MAYIKLCHDNVKNKSLLYALVQCCSEDTAADFFQVMFLQSVKLISNSSFISSPWNKLNENLPTSFIFTDVKVFPSSSLGIEKTNCDVSVLKALRALSGTKLEKQEEIVTSSLWSGGIFTRKMAYYYKNKQIAVKVTPIATATPNLVI